MSSCLPRVDLGALSYRTNLYAGLGRRNPAAAYGYGELTPVDPPPSADAFRPKQLLRQPPAASKASPYGSPDATKRSTTPRTDGPPRRGRQSLGSAGGLQEKLDITGRPGGNHRGTTQQHSVSRLRPVHGGDELPFAGRRGWLISSGRAGDQTKAERTSREQCDKELSHRVLRLGGCPSPGRSYTPTRPASSSHLHVLLRHLLLTARRLRGLRPDPRIAPRR